MKYNNGDMDDLFRRASEGYPLRTDSDDWNRLAADLDGVPAPPSDEEKRRRRGIFWWFLLIPLAGVGYLTWQLEGSHMAVAKVQTAKVVVRGNAGVAGTQTGDARTQTGDAATRASGVRTGAGDAGSQTGNAATRTGNTAAQTGNAGTRSAARNSVRPGNVTGAAVVDRSDLSAGSLTAGSLTAGSKDVVEGVHGKKRGKTAKSEKVTTGGTGVKMTDYDHDPMLALLDLRRAPIGGGYYVDVDVVAPKMTAGGKTPSKKNSTAKNSHGYIGISGAPDFSTVRFQSMKGVGTTFGVLLGYSFNDRWAVESGLYLDRKSYYTAGEYFKKSMPSGYKLLNVNGSCDMWEIPVNVRYNLSTGPRIKWFATAGLSTYLMSSENYNYSYQYNWQTEDSNWNIRKPSQYWFSIVNLSAGFEQRLGKIGNLRLEPYIRIPFSGIGTGSLHILSAGVNIGFTHQLW
ncbi:MAG TPA: outer membrane beta-barrel protein [Puia sp.]|jgi:hypothetical protein|nr:outer membrane beta-barrel protein [Puia sp.]